MRPASCCMSHGRARYPPLNHSLPLKSLLLSFPRNIRSTHLLFLPPQFINPHDVTSRSLRVEYKDKTADVVILSALSPHCIEIRASIGICLWSSRQLQANRNQKYESFNIYEVPLIPLVVRYPTLRSRVIDHPPPSLKTNEFEISKQKNTAVSGYCFEIQSQKDFTE